MFTIYTFPEHKRNIKKPKLKQGSWVAGHRAWDPPDPIPNSEVKPRSVSGASMVFGHVKPEKLAIHLNIKRAFLYTNNVSTIFFCVCGVRTEYFNTFAFPPYS
jgi:hypothetical protein